MVFIPGAKVAKWLLPKWFCWAPAATIRLSKGTTVSIDISLEVTVLAFRSMFSTSPSNTWQFRFFLRISRVVGAISPADRIPVANW